MEPRLHPQRFGRDKAERWQRRHRGRGAIAGWLQGAGQDPEHQGFGQGKGRLCGVSQCRRELGESWGLGAAFPAERRELKPFPCIRDLGGTLGIPRGRARGGDTSTGTLGLAEPGSSRKSAPERRGTAGGNGDASLSERSRPRSPPSLWQQEMEVMGESPRWKGRRRATQPCSRQPFPSRC